MKWKNKYHFELGHPVVLVIDMQNDFCDENGAYHRNDPLTFPVRGMKAMIFRLQHFLAEARKNGTAILYVKYLVDDQGRDVGLHAKTPRPFLLKEGLRRNTWGGEIVEALKPFPGDFIIEKSRYSAFYNTKLETVLRALRAETLFLTGVATHVCVESTIRDAYFRDYPSVLVEDCCQAWNEESHLAAVRNVLHGFGMVMTSAEVLEALQKF
jgi:ureidoacrylate peracid hydrolase